MKQQVAQVLKNVQAGFQGVGNFRPRLNFPGLRSSQQAQPLRAQQASVQNQQVIHNTQAMQPVQQARPVDDLAQFEQSEGISESVKSLQMEFWAVVGPFIIWLITGYAEGYFFSGFRPLTLFFSDSLTFLGYGTGFTLAAFTLNAIIKSAQHYHDGNKKACYAMIAAALLLATGSVVGQYMTLEVQVVLGHANVQDSAIERIPIFSWIVGVGGLRGHDWLFFFRSALLLLGEFVAIYAMPTKREDAEKTIKRRREHARMLQDLRNDQQLEKLNDLIWEQARQAVQQNFLPQNNTVARIEQPKSNTFNTPVSPGGFLVSRLPQSLPDTSDAVSLTDDTSYDDDENVTLPLAEEEAAQQAPTQEEQQDVTPLEDLQPIDIENIQPVVLQNGNHSDEKTRPF